jgi:hypothetical protein
LQRCCPGVDWENREGSTGIEILWELQQKQFNLLSQEEIDAIAKLRSADADALVGGASLTNKLENRKKRKFEDSDMRGGYINADFILGSAAEVERCWSIARYLKTTQRAKMSPHVFEAIMRPS